MARVMGSGCGVTGQPAQVAMCSGVTLQVCFGTCGTVCAGMAMGVPGCVQVCTSAPGGYTWLGGAGECAATLYIQAVFPIFFSQCEGRGMSRGPSRRDCGARHRA